MLIPRGVGGALHTFVGALEPARYAINARYTGNNEPLAAVLERGLEQGAQLSLQLDPSSFDPQDVLKRLQMDNIRVTQVTEPDDLESALYTLYDMHETGQAGCVLWWPQTGDALEVIATVGFLACNPRTSEFVKESNKFLFPAACEELVGAATAQQPLHALFFHPQPGKGKEEEDDDEIDFKAPEPPSATRSGVQETQPHSYQDSIGNDYSHVLEYEDVPYDDSAMDFLDDEITPGQTSSSGSGSFLDPKSGLARTCVPPKAPRVPKAPVEPEPDEPKQVLDEMYEEEKPEKPKKRTPKTEKRAPNAPVSLSKKVDEQQLTSEEQQPAPEAPVVVPDIDPQCVVVQDSDFPQEEPEVVTIKQEPPTKKRSRTSSKTKAKEPAKKKTTTKKTGTRRKSGKK